MSYLLRSRFIREEFLKWSLSIALLCWAITATAWAISKNARTVLIGVSDETSYVIATENASLQKKELLSFAKEFLLSFYQYSPESFGTQISRAGDLMANDCWEQHKAQLASIGDKLKKEPLSQVAVIDSIEAIDDENFDAFLNLTVSRKLEVTHAKIRVTLKISKKRRSESNPWPFEILEFRDAII